MTAGDDALDPDAIIFGEHLHLHLHQLLGKVSGYSVEDIVDFHCQNNRLRFYQEVCFMPIINARHYAFKLGDQEILTWPEHIAIELFNQQPVMGAVRFTDGAAYHPRLLEHVMTLQAEGEMIQTLQGGAVRVDDLQAWDIVEADLITLRALKLCGDMMHSERVRIASAYGIVVGKDSYLPPQVPDETAVASVVYIVDAGEMDANNGSSGKLSFTHRHLDGYTARSPEPVTSGLMLAFPADMLSTGLPYTGNHPRVLLYWHMASS